MSSHLPTPDSDSSIHLAAKKAQDDLELVTRPSSQDAEVDTEEHVDEMEEDDELLDAEQAELETPVRTGKKRAKLYCFHCNRPEFHHQSMQKKWYYPYLLGFSLGTIRWFGPYRCVCCGHRRLTRLHHAHPRMIARGIMGKQTAPSDRK